MENKDLENNAEINSSENAPCKCRKAKRFKAVTALVIIAVVVLNIIVSVWGDINLVYIDLTKTKYKSAKADMYTLSEMCRDLVGNEAIPMIKKVNEEREQRGEQPLKLNIIFCSDKDIIENDPVMTYISYSARSIAKSFSDLINVDYINMSENPSAIQKYKTTSAATINNSDVIVEFGSEYLVQGANSFYVTDTGASNPWAYNGEKKLASMILAVTRAEAPICCITYNHGETLFDKDGEVRADYSTFIKLIGGAGYDVQFIDLEREEIPANCRMIVVFDPQYDFKAFGNLGEGNVSEIEKIDKYLDEANAFFYVCDKDTPVLKNLEEYLEEWGITVTREENAAGILENYALEDLVNCTDSGKGNIMVGNYATEGMGASLTADMRARSYPPRVVFGNSAAIKPAENYIKRYVAADEDAGTAAYSYYAYYKNGNSRSMLDIFTTHGTASAKIGGEIYEIATEYNLFKLMTVTQELRQVQEDNFSAVNRASYVISLSSSDFLKNDVLDSTAYGNTDVVLSTLRNTGNEVIPTNVDLKAIYVYDMANNKAYSTHNPTVWTQCLIIIPAVLIFGVGLVVNVRRKYR